MQITDKFISTGSPCRCVDYLMPEDSTLHKQAMMVSSGGGMFPTDLTKFDHLMMETREVILSPEFGKVVEVSLKELIDALVEDLETQTTEGTLTSGLPLVKLLPRVAQVGSSLLKEPSENRYIQIIQKSPEVELFFTLLYANTPPQP
ncbi:unnamed protein product [Linum tenue]|uniref:Uncharacterized protein n=1 Tax=Linum tenue TaxID=586396 RepID=A0AAV0ILR9_9ROSI|nr:unnamed protein product [Linum tenue]